MKIIIRSTLHLLCLILCLCLTPVAFADDVVIDESNFPDSNFRSYVSMNNDRNGDGKLSDSEITSSNYLYININGISSLKGIEYFTAMTTLVCESIQLSSLDLSNNTALTALWCDNNQLTTLDLSNNIALTFLNCSRNQLRRLDLSNNTALTTLWCEENQLRRLDLSNNTALTALWCDNNQLTTLDLSNNTALTTLTCYNNQLTSLNLSSNTALTTLSCYNNQLTSLNLSSNTALTTLSCWGNQLTSLNLSNNTTLTYLNCDSNQLTTLDLNRNTALTTLSCWGNQLTSLDLRNSTALTTLNCYSNQLTSLEIYGSLQHLECWGNNIATLDISNCPNLLMLVENKAAFRYGSSATRYGGTPNSWNSSEPILIVDNGTTLINPMPDLILPASLMRIDEDAFSGGAFRYVKLSEQTEYIGPFAFANCPNLKYVYIPNQSTSIDDNAFGNKQELVIFGKAGSTADDYAYDHYFDFIAIS